MAWGLTHYSDDASFDFGAQPGNHTVIVAPEGDGHDAVVIPDAHLLFSGAFSRSGSDLVIHGDHGDSVTVAHYFNGDATPALRSPEGAILDAKVVEMLAGPAHPGVYAQAGAPAPDQPAIGKVEKVDGSVTITHVNGVVTQAKAGDVVFKGDVVQSASNSSVGIGFTDGTAFNLSAESRMALNDFVYESNGLGNKAFISLIQGTFGFLAGKVAKSGDMKIDTPVATMGIRGTAVYSHVNLVDGTTEYSVGVEEDGVTVGSFVLISHRDGSTIDTVDNADITTILTPHGNDLEIVHIHKTSGDVQTVTSMLRGAFSAHHLYEDNPLGTPHSNGSDHGSGDNPQQLFSPQQQYNPQPQSFPGNGLPSPYNGSPNNPNNPNQAPPILPISIQQFNGAPTPTLTVSVAVSVTVSADQEQQLLTATAELNGQPQTSGITYQWQIFDPKTGTWQNIPGANSATFNLPTSDDGKLVRVEATYSVNGQTVVADSKPVTVEANPILRVSESVCGHPNVNFVSVGFHNAVALNIFAFEPGGGAVDVVLSGLPKDATLTDRHGDHLQIVNGSITLTQSELAGLTLHTGHTEELISLTVTAVNAEGGSTTAPQHLDIRVTDDDHHRHHHHDHHHRHWFDHDHRHDRDHGHDHAREHHHDGDRDGHHHRSDRDRWVGRDHRDDHHWRFEHDQHGDRDDRFDWGRLPDRDHREVHDHPSDHEHRSADIYWLDREHRADRDRWFDQDHRADREHRFDRDHRDDRDRSDSHRTDHNADRDHGFDHDHRFDHLFAFDHGRHDHDRSFDHDPHDRDHHADRFDWGHGEAREHEFGRGPELHLHGGEVSHGAVLIESGGDLIGHGVVRDAIHNFGTVESKGGDLDIKGDISGHGTLEIDGGSALTLGGSDTNNVTFLNKVGFDDHADRPAALILDDAFNFKGTVSGFAHGDAIDLRDLHFNGGHISTSFSHGVLTVSDGADTARIAFNGNYSANSFNFSNDGHNGVLITERPNGGHDHGDWRDLGHDPRPFDSDKSGHDPDSHVHQLLQATSDPHDASNPSGHGEGPAANVPVTGLHGSDFITHHA